MSIQRCVCCPGRDRLIPGFRPAVARMGRCARASCGNSPTRSGLTDPVLLRRVSNLISGLPGNRPMAQAKRRNTRFRWHGDRGRTRLADTWLFAHRSVARCAPG